MSSSTKSLAVIIILATTSIVVLAIESPYFPPPYTVIPFEVIDPGAGYNYESRANFTITNSTEWEYLWSFLYSGHYPMPEVPFVNFTCDMLIAVFQGERGSSGYLTNITRITMTATNYIVYVDEIHSGENCGTLTVMTYPYQIVKISDYVSNLPVQFVYNIYEYDCG